MNPNSQNPALAEPHAESGEETLRLIAGLPVPAGLEDRVHAVLHSAPRRGRVLAWPAALCPQSNWMRTAAAAAIVFVVVGGGWGVYTRVQHGQAPKVVAMPPSAPASGGFSSAGAVRTPVTLPGPVLTLPVETQTAQPKPIKKPAARPKANAAATGQTTATKPTIQPDAKQ